jgi:hypothetical protein
MDLGRTREHDGIATACRARGLGEPEGALGVVGGPRSPRPQERATTLSQDRAPASAPGRAFGGCPCAVPTLSASLVPISSSDHRSLTHQEQKWKGRGCFRMATMSTISTMATMATVATAASRNAVQTS